MGMTRLSVIVPCYNAEKYIENCLSPILCCSLSDIEVLVINDGSTDDTSIILEKLSLSSSLIKIFNKPNGGVSSARNFGLAHANGDWITFVDADDKVTIDLLSYIPSYSDDLICFNWQYTTGEIEENECFSLATYSEGNLIQFLNLHLQDYILRTPWAKIFRRSIIHDNHLLFDEAFKIGEDNLFMLDYLFHCNRMSTVNILGYIYLRPEKGKYPLPFQKAADFMTLFMEKYDRLHVCCQPLLLLLDLYYFISLSDDSMRTRIAWEQIPAIRHLQHLCWNNYGKREKLKIMIRNILSIFYAKRTV